MRRGQATLAEFVRSSSAEPFVWGRADCMLWAADWVRHCHGVDPAAAWRGAYTDEAGARRIVETFGGAVAMFEELMGAAGLAWRAVDDPQPGDVGVIDTPRGPMGAIRGRCHWLARCEGRGVAFLPGPHLGAWTVCPRP